MTIAVLSVSTVERVGGDRRVAAAALAIGAFNGILVIRTKLPSFIITLGTCLSFAARP